MPPVSGVDPFQNRAEPADQLRVGLAPSGAQRTHDALGRPRDRIRGLVALNGVVESRR